MSQAWVTGSKTKLQAQLARKPKDAVQSLGQILNDAMRKAS